MKAQSMAAADYDLNARDNNGLGGSYDAAGPLQNNSAEVEHIE